MFARFVHCAQIISASILLNICIRPLIKQITPIKNHSYMYRSVSCEQTNDNLVQRPIETDSSNKESKPSLNGFVLIISPDGMIRYVSATVQSHLDFISAEMIDRAIFEFLAEDDYPSMQTALSCLNNNYPIIFPKIFECWMICKGHSNYRRVIMHVALLRQKGDEMGRGSVSEDIILKSKPNSAPSGLACLARASKLSLSPQPRSLFGFGKFTTILSLPSTTIQQINACEIHGLCKIDIDAGTKFMDYVYEDDRSELTHYFNLVTSTATDIQPTSSYFTIFPSSVISSFYRIQISGANINTATSCSGDRSKAVTSLSGFAGNDNSSVGVKYQNRRHALVQSSSTCLSRSTTEQFGISSEEDNLIVSTHTVIRLVDESQPSSCEMNQQASNCALINGIVTGQSVVSGPATNESSKENNSAQTDHIVTKMRLDKAKSGNETGIRNTRSQRLLQLLTCGRPFESEAQQTTDKINSFPISYFQSENNVWNSETSENEKSNELVCGNILSSSCNQNSRKRGQNKKASSKSSSGTRGGNSAKSKKGRKASQINSTAALSSNITGVCWSTTGSSNSIVNSESFIDSATSRVQTTFMGIEELKRTLTRTLFDREKDCLDGLPTEENLLTIREDPEEREQMIQFVLEASSSCCWTPLADNFLDIIKSELFKIFHEVYLLPAWHRRESTWMNHALQLAKLHYDRIIDEQHQRSQFMQQKTAVNSTQSVASRTRTSPGYCYNQVPTAATVMMNGIVDHQEYQQNEMRIAAHQRQQQMCIAASQQHRSFGRKDGTICLSPTVFMHSSPMQSCIDYDVPIRPSTEDIYHQLNSRCITTPHGLNNIGVGVEYCPSNGRQNQMNEYFYHPRQIVVPGEMWNRQCIPVDRRRFVCNSDGMPLMQPSSMYPGKTMTKDGDIVIDHMISDCSANGSMSPNQIATTSQCRSGVNSGIYISPSPNSYSPIQTNIQTNQFQQSNNDVYSSPASISPLRINSDCSQMTVASYHQQHPQQLLHQQPHQYQQQRFRLMDSGTMNSMNGGHYNAQFIDQSEYARFRPNFIPDGGNQVMHRGMSPQVQPIMQVGSNQALE